MRMLLILATLAGCAGLATLAGCAGYDPGPQQAGLPYGSGGASSRDEFYDGGVFDRDLVPDPGDTTRDPL